MLVTLKAGHSIGGRHAIFLDRRILVGILALRDGDPTLRGRIRPVAACARSPGQN